MYRKEPTRSLDERIFQLPFHFPRYVSIWVKVTRIVNGVVVGGIRAAGTTAPEVIEDIARQQWHEPLLVVTGELRV